MPRQNDIRLATSVSVAGCDSCECGLVTIRLHDRRGAIFATAQMPPETARSLVAMVQEGTRERPAGLDGIRCEGTA